MSVWEGVLQVIWWTAFTTVLTGFFYLVFMALTGSDEDDL